MMTREEILSIEEYCAEHKISHKKRLEELEIPFSGELDEIASSFGHSDLISAARSAMESPYVRCMKMLSQSL